MPKVKKEGDVVMKWILSFVAITSIMALQAKDWYVDGVNGNDSQAGATWASAKKTISSAYYSASDGDVVHVADGVYPRISLDGNKSVTIKSEGGWAKATIDANRENRCAYLGSEGGTNIVLQGFTLTNGYRDGSGAGAYGGTLKDCRIMGNETERSGGAAYGSYLYGCLVISNVAGNCAGAVYNGRMVACKVYSNVATNWGGAFYGGVAENCVIAGNSCGRYGGGAYETTLFGCTVFGNSAGLGAGGIYDSSATNSIIWANMVGKQIKNYYGGTFGRCVLYPMAEGTGNTSENPRLFSVESLDGRICVGSPCFNTGDNDAVHELVDVDGNARIQKGTVDIGAYEGVVDGGGDFVEDAEKTLTVSPGVTSSFSLDDGSRAFIFGISPLSANDFEEITEDGVLEYVNSGIIDAEKIPATDIDDYWCQQLTEVNLCVWSGWSQYVGFLNEDDFADFIRSKGEFANRQNILKWVMGKSGYNYQDYVSWSWASKPDMFVNELIERTKDGNRWIYLQLDWVTPGTTDIIGSHAITCCGYQLANGKTGDAPDDLVGLYIIDSDNDKRTGIAGRYAPNAVTRIPVTWDTATQKFFLKFPRATGMARFLCYLKACPYRYAEASIPMAKGAVPYSWLVSHGIYDPTTDESPEAILARPTGKRDGLGRELTVWHDYLAGTDPLNANDVFRCQAVSSNEHLEVTCSPNLGNARRYAVYGTENLADATWLFPTNESSRFLTVGIEMGDTIKANGFGFIDGAELVATNRFAMSRGALSLYSDTIVDAEKIDGTDLDDRGCGEATGANMVVMTGWAQLAGFEDEDDVFRSFYQIDGTADYGIYSVVKYVFERLPDYLLTDYYESADKFDATTFSKIEEWLDRGCAVGIKYLHGTPVSNEGDHVVTVWGVCKDLRYLPADPRHYSAVIISDSDDDKHGYVTAKESPNRVKIWPVSWNETDKVYYIDDGFLVDVRSLAPAPGYMTECALNSPGSIENDLMMVAAEPISISGTVTPEPVTPEPVMPEPVSPEPVMPVDPEPEIEPAPIYAGVLDVRFSKAQTVLGALYDAEWMFVGVVELKAGKINKKKQAVKISATATILENGKAKKITAKAVTLKLEANGTMRGTLAFKKPIGNLAFEMAADGTFTLKDTGYEMLASEVGASGSLPDGEHTFTLEDFDLNVPGELQGDLLPDGETFKVKGKKWTFAKNATVKVVKDRKTKEYELVVDTSKGKANLSSLKLTYTANTGLFKGTFKVYAVEEAKGGAKKLKKYTVNVIGFVMGGAGAGQATVSKPKGGPWAVTLE